MNKFTLIIPLSLASQLVLAQTSPPIGYDAEQNLAKLGKVDRGSIVRVYDNRYEGVKGTPYFNSEWSKGSITAGNTVYENVDVKYNSYDGELLYRNSKGEEFVLMPFKVDAFVLRDKDQKQAYVFKKFPLLATKEPRLEQRFVVALHEGEKVQLVMEPQKTFVKANYQGAYSPDTKYDEFKDSQNYFLLQSSGEISKVKLTKKYLLRVLPNKQDQVDAYIKTEHIDAGTEAGWVKALTYYESL